MVCFSLEPDDDVKWIYDPYHPDYNSERAEHLRNSRASALRAAPSWMVDQAAVICLEVCRATRSFSNNEEEKK